MTRSEVEEAAFQAAKQLAKLGVFEVLNFDPMNPKNVSPPKPVDLQPKKER